jgi:hypothetical protein
MTEFKFPNVVLDVSQAIEQHRPKRGGEAVLKLTCLSPRHTQKPDIKSTLATASSREVSSLIRFPLF